MIADELITRGWCQHQMVDGKGRVCMAGAIRAWVTGDLKSLPSADKFDKILVAHRTLESKLGLPIYQYSVTAWNDDPARTYDEVLRMAKELDEALS